jgi:hypothetical protein
MQPAFFAVIVATLALAACARGDRVESSNPSNVVVIRDTSVAAATALAYSECEKYGKDSRLVTIYGMIMSFDCVTRTP